MSRFIIDLSSQQPVAEGAQQIVYQHPSEPDQLIKVRKPYSKSYRFRRPASRRFRALRLWHLEISEYLAALAKLGHHFDRMPRMFGFCDTSMGPAVVVERIKGPDGRIALTLTEVLKALDGDQQRFDSLLKDAEALFDDLFDAGVEWKDVGLQNIVVAGGDTPHLVVIDGMGKSPLVPLALMSDRIFKASHARDKQRFLDKMMEYAPNNR